MGTLHATFLPWYKAILGWAKSKGANPFGDEKAKQLYEKYFPPYLTKKRDVDDVNWDFYKEIAKAWMEYFTTGKKNDLLKEIEKATGMITPYDKDFKTWLLPLWPSQPPANTTLLSRLGITLPVNAMGKSAANIPNPMSHPY